MLGGPELGERGRPPLREICCVRCKIPTLIAKNAIRMGHPACLLTFCSAVDIPNAVHGQPAGGSAAQAAAREPIENSFVPGTIRLWRQLEDSAKFAANEPHEECRKAHELESSYDRIRGPTCYDSKGP